MHGISVRAPSLEVLVVVFIVNDRPELPPCVSPPVPILEVQPRSVSFLTE